ncbi:MAG: T9SS type A sorting domain-containing protein [Chitinophagales bacterium]
MKYFILLSIVAQLCSNAYPQGRDANWVFGDSVGLYFGSDGSITSYPSVIKGFESQASISDSLGNLLFYTNGVNVWTYNHEVMSNGDGLEIGQIFWEDMGSSITQGVIILPTLKKPNEYYIFYIAYSIIPIDNFGLRYSIVDMNLNSGMGEVISKNISIYEGITTEKLSAIKHANGRDWWLISRQRISGEPVDSLKFIKFLVSPNGIDGPYYQSYGAQNEWSYLNLGYYGEMVFSPQGDKLAYTAGTNLDIYDFDRCTGQLGHEKTIYDIADQFTYGCAFSPDGNKIYVSTFQSDNLYQYCLNCEKEIDSTQELIYHVTGNYDIGQLELGPDNKIYFTTPYGEIPNEIYNVKTMNLCVINNPNELGLACDVDTNTIYLGGERTLAGLPNMPNYNLGALAGSGCDTLTSVIQSIENNHIQFYPNPAYEYIIISGEINPNDIIKIYSADGRVVLHEKINTTNTKVDISTLPSGVYVIQISEDGWVKYSEKLLKE